MATEPNKDQDQEKDQEKEQEQEQEQEVKSKEPKDDDIVYDTVIDGQSCQLNRKQLDHVVYLGLLKASEQTEKKKSSEKKSETDSAKIQTKNEVAELKEDMTRREIQQVNSDVEEAMEDVDVPDFFKQQIKQQTFIAVAQAMKKGDSYSTKKILKSLVKSYKDELGKLNTPKKVDLEEKEEDKKKTKFTGSGRSSGQEPDKPLDRFAFRDGRLAKRVAAHMEKLGEKD